MGLNVFRDVVLGGDAKLIIGDILLWVENERSFYNCLNTPVDDEDSNASTIQHSEKTNSQVVKQLCKMLTSLSTVNDTDETMYQNEFQPQLQRSTAMYYKQNCLMWLEHLSIPQYLFKIDLIILRERERTCEFLMSSSATIINETCFAESIGTHVFELVNVY